MLEDGKRASLRVSVAFFSPKSISAHMGKRGRRNVKIWDLLTCGAQKLHPKCHRDSFCKPFSARKAFNVAPAVRWAAATPRLFSTFFSARCRRRRLKFPAHEGGNRHLNVLVFPSSSLGCCILFCCMSKLCHKRQKICKKNKKKSKALSLQTIF